MSNEVFNEGPTTSQHVESTDDNHFHNTTFKLKRTRSMGLLIDNPVVPFSNSNSPTLGPSDCPVEIPVSSLHSQPSGTPNSKLQDGSFIPKEALNKLNLKTPHTTSSSNNLFRTNIINRKVLASSSPNALSYDYPTAQQQQQPHNHHQHHHHHNHRHFANLPTSPQSLPSVDNSCSDDVYNSEDSLSSISASASPNSSVHNSSICLIPKHQLKKAAAVAAAAAAAAATTATTASDTTISFDTLSSEHEQHQDLTNLLHDDIDVKDCPEQHVDYLTHKWKEDEISKSWKYVTLRRGNVADSARLENASWRTWAQTRLNLKTISPEELNWSKDSDVTWLYGPVIKPSTHQDVIIPNDRRGNMDILMTSSTLPTTQKSNSNNDTNTNTNSNTNTNPTLNTTTSTNAYVSSPRLSPVDNRPPLHSTDSDPGNGEHLKSILKKKSNVEKMISDASYSRLQHLLESRHINPPIKSIPSDVTLTDGNSSQQTLTNSAFPHSNSLSRESSTIIHNTAKRYPRTHLSPTQTPSATSTTSKITTSTTSTSTSTPTSTSTSTSTSTLNLAGRSIKSSLKNSSLHMQKQPPAQTSTLPPKKHIHFNMRVDQCIALAENDVLLPKTDHDTYMDSSDESDHYPVSKMVRSTYREDNDHPTDSEMEVELEFTTDSDSDSDSDSSSDEGFILGTGDSRRLIHHQPVTTTAATVDIRTIAPLPATTIKFASDDELALEQQELQLRRSANSKYTVSHNTRTNRGYDYYYDYNTVYSDKSNPTIYGASTSAPSTTAPSQEAELFDVPENCQLDSDSNDIPVPLSLHTPLSPLLSSSPPQAPLKRTSSIGSRSSSTQSLASIKVGLSGLDLTSTGLKRSTGGGSKPQLFQLASTPQPASASAPASSASPGGKKKFLFTDSSDSDSDVEMPDVHEERESRQASIASLGSMGSIGSLADVNRQFRQQQQQQQQQQRKQSAFSFGESDESESESE